LVSVLIYVHSIEKKKVTTKLGIASLSWLDNGKQRVPWTAF